ncbi:MAG: hypothetical protein A2Y53_06500 [Chloroflexi bacterium RBG_16_47_49]|nr:MAG: hypothetical protein A2Y53_06500 [Chloroflexi bacterium RBG_16_47_49]
MVIGVYKDTFIFQKRFYENRVGGVRLTLKLTPFLVETLPIWANKIEPVIEQVKVILLKNKLVKEEKAIQLHYDENLVA